MAVTPEDIAKLKGGDVLKAFFAQFLDASGYIFGPTIAGPAPSGGDDTAAIQAKLDLLPTPGGKVQLQAAQYIVNGTLNIADRDNVVLAGAGAAHAIYAGSPTTGTILKRTSGSGDMVNVDTTVASSEVRRGNSVCGMTIDANGLASRCLKLTSQYGGVYSDLHLRNATVAAFDTTTRDLAGLEDTQLNRFQRFTIRQIDGAGGSGIGVRLGSGAAGLGNTSGNELIGMLVYHKDGGGYQLGDADSNRFIGCVANWSSGSGIGLELKASNTAFTGHARANAFWHCEFANGIVARATGFSQPSVNNWLFWSRESSPGAGLTIEPGATFFYEELSTGNTVRNSFTLSGGPSFKSNAGSPEGVVTAPPGSYCADSTNGEGYIKKTGTGNTGWKLVTHA